MGRNSDEDPEVYDPLPDPVLGRHFQGPTLQWVVDLRLWIWEQGQHPLFGRDRGFYNLDDGSSSLTILFDFDDTLSYVNNMLISISNEVERTKNLLLDTQKHFKFKKSWVDNLELQLKNITIDRDIVKEVNILFVKQ